MTAPIPSYTMQTSKLSISICNDIDRLNRNFLWGETDNKRKVHLVNWDTVCKPKNNGGLGLRKSVDNNTAINSKLGWQIMNGGNTPWIKMMRDKYGCSYDPKCSAKEAKSSHIWKCISSSKDVITSATKWNIGNGTKISIWKD